MSLLWIGLALWWGAHLMKRLAPDLRAHLANRLGKAAHGAFAIAILVSVLLMTLGYRAAEGPVFWDRSAMTTGLNNLLVLLAFYCFASSGAKTWLVQFTRHPQLIGFALWAAAHLLVNGDLASLILFGSLLFWSLVEMAVISAQDGPYHPPAKAPRRKEITAIVITLVLYAVVAGVHTLLGYFPFGA